MLQIPVHAHAHLEMVDFPRRMTLLAESPYHQNNFLSLFEYFVPTDKIESSGFEHVLKFLVHGIEPFIAELFIHAQDFLERQIIICVEFGHQTERM